MVNGSDSGKSVVTVGRKVDRYCGGSSRINEF